jgi:hypothetical protein
MKLRKLLSLSTSLILTASFITAMEIQSASAEICPVNELSPLFFEEYFPGIKWDNSSGMKIITWTTNVTNVNFKDITRPFTPEEESWLDLSFNSWDIALDTVTFKRVTDPTTAQIRVGYVPINYDGYWTVELDNNFRISGTIEISSVPEFTKFKDGFIESAQSEIGNILGLGDMPGTSTLDSVLKDPDTAPYGSLPLSDTDIDLMRQFYGESTCHEAWSPALKAAKAEALAIMTKVAQEASAKAKVEADRVAAEKAAADKLIAEAAAKVLSDKGAADAAANAAAAAKLKKKTITCIKGKLIKKVTAVKPVCPKGYALKK